MTIINFTILQSVLISILFSIDISLIFEPLAKEISQLPIPFNS